MIQSPLLAKRRLPPLWVSYSLFSIKLLFCLEKTVQFPKIMTIYFVFFLFRLKIRSKLIMTSLILKKISASRNWETFNNIYNAVYNWENNFSEEFPIFSNS
jgi:hypothetical protein